MAATIERVRERARGREEKKKKESREANWPKAVHVRVGQNTSKGVLVAKFGPVSSVCGMQCNSNGHCKGAKEGASAQSSEALDGKVLYSKRSKCKKKENLPTRRDVHVHERPTTELSIGKTLASYLSRICKCK